MINTPVITKVTTNDGFNITSTENSFTSYWCICYIHLCYKVLQVSFTILNKKYVFRDIIKNAIYR